MGPSTCIAELTTVEEVVAAELIGHLHHFPFRDIGRTRAFAVGSSGASIRLWRCGTQALANILLLCLTLRARLLSAVTLALVAALVALHILILRLIRLLLRVAALIRRLAVPRLLAVALVVVLLLRAVAMVRQLAILVMRAVALVR